MESSNDSKIASGAIRRRHIVSIPYPGRGHINPMINLCRLLSARDLTITIIVTEEWLNILSSASPSPDPSPNIHFRTIPNLLPSENARGNNYAEFIEAVLTKMEHPIQLLLDEIYPPADIIVADALLPWIVGVCERRNVPTVALWTESASVLFALYMFDRLDASGRLPNDFSDYEALAYLPDAASMRTAGLQPDASSLDILRAFARYYYWFHSAHILLTTSFDELEAFVMDKIRLEFSIPIYQVGPLIPHTPSSKPTNTPSYLSWLDSQPKCSVLYVSLGSFLPISPTEMEEISVGLMESGIHFLWVVRENLCPFMEVEANAAVCAVVPWCDQLGVLCHPSVGGFLTHCGWNSTLEAVYAGVPMITCPLFWDQQPNSKLVVDEWRIGLRLKENGGEIVGREMVAEKVRKLMDVDDEESKGMRERSAEMKEMCFGALKVGGGSSEFNLNEFIKQIGKIC